MEAVRERGVSPAHEAAPAETSQLTRQRRRAAYLFVLPMLVILAAVAGWPLVRTIYFSFTDANLSSLESYKVIGTGNFQSLAIDADWWNAVWNTMLFAVISVVIETILGLVIALTLNAHIPGRGLLRAAVLIPWAIPTVVSAQMWGWMCNDLYGVMNHVLHGARAHPPAAGLDRQPRAGPDRGGAGGRVEDDAVHGAADPGGAAARAAGDLRGGAHRRDPPGQGLLEGDPAADPAGADGGRHLPRRSMRCGSSTCHLRPDRQQQGRRNRWPIYARQQLVDFQDVGYGSAAATFLFLVVAVFTVVYITAGRVRFGTGER